MALNTYECMFLLDPAKASGDAGSAATQVEAILTKNHAEVLASRQWDERRLAYPVKGHKKGLYYLTYFRSEGKNLVNIERDCALNETILRYLALRVHPKLVDTMLALARDEHALALQAVPEAVESDAAAPVIEEDSGRPKRSRRYDEERKS
jgi:small subunit ribosomal protein S6